MIRKKFITESTVLLFIGLLFLLDILNKFNFTEDTNIALLIKLIKTSFELIFLTFLLINWKSTKYFFYFLSFIILVFVIGQLNLQFNLGLNQFYNIELLRYTLLYLFPLIYLKFFEFSSNKPFRESKLEFLLLLILVVNTICILLGALFDIEFFKTYDKNRWGYMGLMPRSITASYFYIVGIFYLYSKIQTSQKYVILFVLSVIGAVLVGTKSIYLYLSLLLVYHIVVNQYYKLKTFYFLGTFILGMGIFFQDFIFEQIIQRFFSGLYNLYEQKGWLTAIMSYRDTIFKENVGFYTEKWNFINYIFGGKIFETALFENSLLDLGIFFGIVGSVSYLFFFYKKLVHNKSSFIQINLLFILIISIFAGQFFSNISAMAYLCSFMFLINKTQIKNS